MRTPPLSTAISPYAAELFGDSIFAWQRRVQGALSEIRTIRHDRPMSSDATPSVDQVLRALERALVVLDSLGSSDQLERRSQAAAGRAPGRRPFNDVSRRTTLS